MGLPPITVLGSALVVEAAGGWYAMISDNFA